MERLRAVRVFRSSGTGRRMISLKKSFSEADLALPQHRLVGTLGIPPELTTVNGR